VNSADDKIVETASGGIDTVQSKSLTYTLPGSVENLTLTSSVAQVGIGKALGNLMISNGAASTLNGGDSNDILVAGRYANVLTGGAGSDIFQFKDTPYTPGHITDFRVGTDVLDLRTLLDNYHGTNPVASGYLSFTAVAGGTQVYFDLYGSLCTAT
jgi:Ca2+-binding RTX toxin-like protein